MTRNDEGLDALLVDNVADIEAAVAYIKGTIDPLLWQGAAEVLEKESRPWGRIGNFDPDGKDSLWIMPPDWVTDPSRGVKIREDAWFSLIVSEAGPDESETALANFLAVGGRGNGMVLSFQQEMLKGQKWKAVLARQEDAVQAIRDGGFMVEMREGLLEIPVLLKAEELSRALSEEDVSSALGPLRDAVARAIALKPRFDEIVAAARAVAYG